MSVVSLMLESGQTVPAIAEDVGVPGIALTACHHIHATPHWRLTHAPSGWAITTCRRGRAALRKAARRLAALGDWTISAEEIVHRQRKEPEWDASVRRTLEEALCRASSTSGDADGGSGGRTGGGA